MSFRLYLFKSARSGGLSDGIIFVLQQIGRFFYFTLMDIDAYRNGRDPELRQVLTGRKPDFPI